MAEVSNQTVSRVLNGERYVSADKRDRVLAAVRQVGYRPNALARGLVRRRSRLIGVLAPGTPEPGVQRGVTAVELAARDHGYSVLLTTADPEDPGSSAQGVERLLAGGVEGVVAVVAHESARRALVALAEDVPCVLLASEAVQVATEQRAPAAGEGVRAAVQHLVDLGHERVLHLAGPRGWIAADVRRAVYGEALASAGLEPLEPVEVGWSPDAGYHAGRRLLPLDGVTAVLAASDQVAIGFLAACREAGVDVPGDLSVVGYDDVPEAPYTSPPLTTVRRDEAHLGAWAVDLLAGLLDPHPEGRAPAPEPRPARPHLVVRRSTAAPG